MLLRHRLRKVKTSLKMKEVLTQFDADVNK